MSKLDAKEELTMSCQDKLRDSQSCESLAYIPMKISTPINLEPCIKELPITVCPMGEPVLEETPCGSFILTQELCVKVGIEITIEANVGNTKPFCCNEDLIWNWAHMITY